MGREFSNLIGATNLERNIRKVYRRANDAQFEAGLVWYDRAHAEAVRLSEVYQTPLEKTVDVFACLSPGTRYERNLYETGLYLEAAKANSEQPRATTYGHMAKLAWKIAKSSVTLPDVCNGPKVNAFARNILRPHESEAVTIDRWAIRAALQVDSRESLSAGQYERFAEAYRKVAKREQLIPCQLQAIVWCVVRGDGE